MEETNSVEFNPKMNEKAHKMSDKIPLNVVLIAIIFILSISMVSLNSTINKLQSDLNSLEGRMSELNSEIQVGIDSSSKTSNIQLELESKIDDLTQCVNDYMDVVGKSGDGYYRYYYC